MSIFTLVLPLLIYFTIFHILFFPFINLMFRLFDTFLKLLFISFVVRIDIFSFILKTQKCKKKIYNNLECFVNNLYFSNKLTKIMLNIE